LPPQNPRRASEAEDTRFTEERVDELFRLEERTRTATATVIGVAFSAAPCGRLVEHPS